MTDTPDNVWDQALQMGRRRPVCKQRTMNRRRRGRSHVMYCRLPMAMAPRLAPRLLTALFTACLAFGAGAQEDIRLPDLGSSRSEEHTSELQSHVNLVCRLLLE